MGIWLQSRVSDLNLDEEGVLKLASFGNEANNKDTIDILKRSLVIRNKYSFGILFCWDTLL